MRAVFWAGCEVKAVGRSSVCGGEESGFTYCGCCMFRLLLIAKSCDVACVMLHDVWSVCGLNQRLCPVSFPSFLLSFFSLCVSPPFAAVSCDLDEPASWFAHMEEAGFQKVPEDDSTTASRVSCLWELHWDKQDLSAVLFWSLSLTEGWLQSWHDTDFDLNSWFLKNPFYVFVFHFYLFWLFYFFILFSSSL